MMNEAEDAQIPFLCEIFSKSCVCVVILRIVREREMKRSDEKIGICVKFQKSFIRLRIVDLASTSSKKDLVVQVSVDVTTYRRFYVRFFKTFFIYERCDMCL